MPLISVVCATFERGAPILDTVRSVAQQSVRDWELIVVSDGSSDDTDQHVEQFARQDRRVRLLRIEHQGHPSPAMNRGLDEARGELVAYIDHDDFWEPHHLATLLAEVDRGRDLVAAGSVWITPDGRLLSRRPPASLFWHPEIQVMSPVFENSQVLHRAELLERTGGWYRQEHGLEDWDMWLRMTDAGARVGTVLEPTVRKTMAAGNRHRSLPTGEQIELLRFPDLRTARRALVVMSGDGWPARLTEALRADLVDWYTRLASAGELVLPTGYRAPSQASLSRQEVAAALEEAARADEGLEDPVDVRLAQDGDAVVLAQRVSCMRASHARRIQELSDGVFRRHRELLREAAAQARTSPDRHHRKRPRDPGGVT